MNKLITKLGGGPGLFWIGLLIVAIILITLFLTGGDDFGGHGHAH
jgi:hypothetical protein